MGGNGMKWAKAHLFLLVKNEQFLFLKKYSIVLLNLQDVPSSSSLHSFDNHNQSLLMVAVATS